MARTGEKATIKITSIEQLMRLISDLHEKRIRRELAEGPELRLRAPAIAAHRARLVGGRYLKRMVSVVGGYVEKIREERIKAIGLEDETVLTEELLATIPDELVVHIAVEGVAHQQSAQILEDLYHLERMFDQEAREKKYRPDVMQRMLEGSPEYFEGIVDRMMAPSVKETPGSK